MIVAKVDLYFLHSQMLILFDFSTCFNLTVKRKYIQICTLKKKKDIVKLYIKAG